MSLIIRQEGFADYDEDKTRYVLYYKIHSCNRYSRSSNNLILYPKMLLHIVQKNALLQWIKYFRSNKLIKLYLWWSLCIWVRSIRSIRGPIILGYETISTAIVIQHYRWIIYWGYPIKEIEQHFHNGQIHLLQQQM